jgi:hypothetical protein
MTQPEAGEFTEVYAYFVSNTEHGDVHGCMVSAAEYDGIEARFAAEGTEAVFNFALKMRNEWAEMIVDIREQAEEMEVVVGGVMIEISPILSPLTG